MKRNRDVEVIDVDALSDTETPPKTPLRPIASGGAPPATAATKVAQSKTKPFDGSAPVFQTAATTRPPQTSTPAAPAAPLAVVNPNQLQQAAQPKNAPRANLAPSAATVIYNKDFTSYLEKNVMRLGKPYPADTDPRCHAQESTFYPLHNFAEVISRPAVKQEMQKHKPEGRRVRKVGDGPAILFESHPSYEDAAVAIRQGVRPENAIEYFDVNEGEGMDFVVLAYVVSPNANAQATAECVGVWHLNEASPSQTFLDGFVKTQRSIHFEGTWGRNCWEEMP